MPLLELGLSEVERNALRRQGIVTSQRKNGTNVYYLRFRDEGRQTTRYLGRNADRARAVAEALRLWQQARNLDRQLGELERESKKQVQIMKQQLKPLLESRGLRFVGTAIRRSRAALTELKLNNQITKET
jgi:hypothetical protein